jgi:hypothetical protein
VILAVVRRKSVSTKPLFWQSSFRWSHSGGLLKTLEITASVIDDVKSRRAISTASLLSALACSTLLVKGLSAICKESCVYCSLFSWRSDRGSLLVPPHERPGSSGQTSWVAAATDVRSLHAATRDSPITEHGFVR